MAKQKNKERKREKNLVSLYTQIIQREKQVFEQDKEIKECFKPYKPFKKGVERKIK